MKDERFMMESLLSYICLQIININKTNKKLFHVSNQIHYYCHKSDVSYIRILCTPHLSVYYNVSVISIITGHY